MTNFTRQSFLYTNKFLNRHQVMNKWINLKYHQLLYVHDKDPSLGLSSYSYQGIAARYYGVQS